MIGTFETLQVGSSGKWVTETAPVHVGAARSGSLSGEGGEKKYSSPKIRQKVKAGEPGWLVPVCSLTSCFLSSFVSSPMFRIKPAFTAPIRRISFP